MARIFLCHASEDRAPVREVYRRLRAIDGFEPWLDEEDLLPGQEWAREIPRALQTSDFILIFLSRSSVAKRGYVQREMKLALDAWQELPEGTIHTIPVRIDDCDVPEPFRRYHWANLFTPNGFDHIVRAIRAEITKRSGLTPLPGPQPSPRPFAPAPQREVQRNEELSKLRKQMIAAQSFQELRSVEYKVDEFLTRYPSDPDGRLLKMQIEVSSRYREKGRPEAHRQWDGADRVAIGLSRRQKRRLVLMVGVLLCVLITALYLVLSGRTPGPQSQDATITTPRPPTQESSNARNPGSDQPASPLTNSLGMQFALIPAGEFQMGSTSGTGHDLVHTVRISKPFYLGLHEVTQGQWEAVMGNNPSYFKVDANRPVEKVSWEEVQKFIDKLNAREGGTLYRLPTEAEWEYAARAGSTTTYSFGDDSGQLGKYAWFADNAAKTTHPVGKLQPNAWGLYDMHGNVWEWVQDWYGTYTTEPVTDPQGPASGSLRVSRGGGWQFTAWYCQSAYRYRLAPGNRLSYLGFRLLRTAL